MESIEEKLARKTMRRAGGCLVWTGTTDRDGYGQVRINYKIVQVHRLAWSLANKQPVPEGKFILHSCDNPPCCEPSHLRPGTHEENMIEMNARGRRWRGSRNLTHCPAGHPYDEANTFFYLKTKGCRICRRASGARRRAKVALRSPRHVVSDNPCISLSDPAREGQPVG